MRKVVELGRQPPGWQEILLETGRRLGAGGDYRHLVKPGTWAQVATTATAPLSRCHRHPHLDGAATSGGATVPVYHAGCWFDIASVPGLQRRTLPSRWRASMVRSGVHATASMFSAAFSHCSPVFRIPSGTKARPVPVTISRSRRGLRQVHQRHHLAALSCCRLILAVDESSPTAQPQLFESAEAVAMPIGVAQPPMRQRDLQWLRRRPAAVLRGVPVDQAQDTRRSRTTAQAAPCPWRCRKRSETTARSSSRPSRRRRSRRGCGRHRVARGMPRADSLQWLDLRRQAAPLGADESPAAAGPSP